MVRLTPFLGPATVKMCMFTLSTPLMVLSILGAALDLEVASMMDSLATCPRFTMPYLVVRTRQILRLWLLNPPTRHLSRTNLL